MSPAGIVTTPLSNIIIIIIITVLLCWFHYIIIRKGFAYNDNRNEQGFGYCVGMCTGLM